MNARRLLSAIAFSAVPVLAVGVGAAPALASSPAATTTTTTTTTAPSPPGATTTTTAPTTTTSSPLAAQTLLSDAMNAMSHERGVTWTYKLSAYGGNFKEVVHDGVKDGNMTSSTTGGGVDAHVAAILHGQIFISGNALGLAQYDNFKPAAAKAQANRWMVVPRSSQYFSAFALNLTVESAVQELYLGTKVTLLSPTTVRGQAVNAVRETVNRNGTTVNETVFMRAHGTPLPVEVILSVNGIAGSIVYSNWGRPPKAHLPKKTVPFQSSWLQGA